jgi:hypothetical protein
LNVEPRTCEPLQDVELTAKSGLKKVVSGHGKHCRTRGRVNSFGDCPPAGLRLTEGSSSPEDREVKKARGRRNFRKKPIDVNPHFFGSGCAVTVRLLPSFPLSAWERTCRTLCALLHVVAILCRATKVHRSRIQYQSFCIDQIRLKSGKAALILLDAFPVASPDRIEV